MTRGGSVDDKGREDESDAVVLRVAVVVEVVVETLFVAVVVVTVAVSVVVALAVTSGRSGRGEEVKEEDRLA